MGRADLVVLSPQDSRKREKSEGFKQGFGFIIFI